MRARTLVRARLVCLQMPPRSISKSTVPVSNIWRESVGICTYTHARRLKTGAFSASKNHGHSVKNPYSQFRDGWSVEQVLQSRKICQQLTKFMCSPTSVSPILSDVAKRDLNRTS